MVHHIVMWKFKPEIEENKKKELKKDYRKKILTALVGKYPDFCTLELLLVRSDRALMIWL